MKLITADASPFVRKVRILILELGLQDAVTLVDPGQITPISNNDRLNAANPLGLIPALRYETAMRPAELQWQTWTDNQNAKVERGLDALESRCGEFEPSPLIGEITVACALGYRDFRFADNDWRGGRPALTQWFEQMMQRDSLASTVPA
jgi:glutathione S-transferase